MASRAVRGQAWASVMSLWGVETEAAAKGSVSCTGVTIATSEIGVQEGMGINKFLFA